MVSFVYEPQVYGLSPPPSEHTSLMHLPEMFLTYTPEAEEPEVLELSPPSQQHSSMRSPLMISIEPDVSSLVTPSSCSPALRLLSICPLTVLSCSPSCSPPVSTTRTLLSLTPSPSLPMLTDWVTPSYVPSVQEVSTKRLPSLTLYTSPEQMTPSSLSKQTPCPLSSSEHTPTGQPPTEYPPTEYLPSEPSEHESPLRLPSEYTSLSELSEQELPELECAPSLKAPSSIKDIPNEIVETPQPRSSYSHSPLLPLHLVSMALTFPLLAYNLFTLRRFTTRFGRTKTRDGISVCQQDNLVCWVYGLFNDLAAWSCASTCQAQ